MLRKAPANVAGLMQMNDELMDGKANAERELEKILSNIARLNLENSEFGGKIRSLELVASQRNHLSKENQLFLGMNYS